MPRVLLAPSAMLGRGTRFVLLPGVAALSVGAAILAAGPARAQAESRSPAEAVAACDRLTAHPTDPDRARQAAPAALTRLNAPAAIAACRRAVELAPNPPPRRLLAQLGRAYAAAANYAEARTWYQKAVEQGSPRAMQAMGDLFASGQGVAQDHATARLWYEKAAMLNDPEALYSLGLVHALGRGTARDDAQALRWYERAAALNHPGAMNEIGVAAMTGRGVAQDVAAARLWFERAAALGHAPAMANLGFLYRDGRGVPQDHTLARNWFERAAALNHAGAMNSLGVLYHNGQGVARDHALARRWYERAAELNNPAAMGNLGLLYENGFGVPQDLAAARLWYERGAALNDASSANHLGRLYQQGRGVAVDEAAARRWYERAAALGHANAKKTLEGLPARRADFPVGTPMSFFIAEGVGTGATKRWIAAAGQIRPDTDLEWKRFVESRAPGELNGLPLVLYSGGGSLQAALRMGRMVRRLGLTVTVGRTLEAGVRDGRKVYQLSTRDALCASACVNLLMGGARRVVAEQVNIGVHQFGRSINASGNFVREDVSIADFSRAQMTTAELAAYCAEMGIDPGLLQITSSVTVREIRRLTVNEIVSTRLAMIEDLDTGLVPMEWVFSDLRESPLLVGAHVIEDGPSRQVAEEVSIRCSAIRGFFIVDYRQVLRRFEAGAGPITLTGVRLVSASEDFIIRSRPVQASQVGGRITLSQWVPVELFDEALATRVLKAEPRPGAGGPAHNLVNDGYLQAYPQLKRLCEARPQQAIGNHPVH